MIFLPKIGALFALLFILSPCTCVRAQQMNITGGQLYISDGSVLVLKNTSLQTDGVVETGPAGSLRFVGESGDTVKLGGTTQPIVAHVELNRANAGLRLTGALTVTNSFVFQAGVLDLAADTMTLNSGGLLVDESTASYATTGKAGAIRAYGNTEGPSNDSHPGNLGLSLESASDFGAFTVIRSHQPDTIDGVASIDRTYQIIDTTTDIVAFSTFRYFDHELNGYDEATLQFATSPQGALWDYEVVQQRSVEDNTAVLTNDLEGGIGRITLVPAPGLPLDLLSFTGQVETKYNQLIWTTANEEDFDGFVVERSISSFVWQDLTSLLPSEVGAAAGAGQGMNEQGYAYEDRDLVASAYYRLRMVDLDGSFTYSNVIHLERELMGGQMIVFPNPNSGVFSVDLPLEENEFVRLTCYELTGRILFQTQSGHHYEQQMKLPAGFYLLTADLPTGRTTRRVIVR